MPTIEENLNAWQNTYHWVGHGEEWSRHWGSPKNQWDAMIWPRIEGYLHKLGTILEIAPGHGRWTKFLERYSKKYYGVDLAPACVECCKYFFNDEKFEFHCNDGISLGMIPDDSCDFVFSFDSLVHAEIDVLLLYLPQIYRKLRDNGAAFLHFSNLGGLDQSPDITHWRARSTSLVSVVDYAMNIGFHCDMQETIPWCGQKDLDCMVIIRRKNG